MVLRVSEFKLLDVLKRKPPDLLVLGAALLVVSFSPACDVGDLNVQLYVYNG